MSVLLSDLVEDLTEDIPAVGGVPSDEQYQRAVVEAVEDFGRRAGRLKRTTLSVTSGTATYELPADFLKMVRIADLSSPNGVIISSQGIIPVSPAFRETWRIAGGQITFYPTPQYTLARAFDYKAGFALTDDDYGSFYEDMTAEEGRIALLLAKSRAVKMQLKAAAGGGFRYRIGDVEVDKSSQGEQWQQQMQGFEQEYLAAVDSYVGSAVG